ncbi:hypothetical protein [Jatrophihabitans sp.]|uniref:WD40/YVTN/BNR-like repeat-containing protein n=1 Tax=Jatrophihabitans sp. TaxID=1932789 RepID=UPI0030C706F4|nr:exo-alpha-sialidase [Jatrophihabitans sp.]
MDGSAYLDGAVIGVGTAGAGAWFSADGGRGFRHAGSPLDLEGRFRAMVVSPHDPTQLYAVADFAGIFGSQDGGASWAVVNGELDDQELWSISCAPHDPQRLYVGGRPGLYCSDDRGATFRALPTGMDPVCPIGTPRITNIVVDPRDADHLWIGVEVDGVYRSLDRGATWRHLEPMGPTPFHGDVHGLALRYPDDPQAAAELWATTPRGVATSLDGGESWSWRSVDQFAGIDDRPYAYCRGLLTWPGRPETIVVGCGDYVPGQVGAVEISRDGGRSWTRPTLDVTPNSTVYCLAVHPELPGLIVAATLFGQVYVSSDYAANWAKLPREFGEIRTLTLAPSTVS